MNDEQKLNLISKTIFEIVFVIYSVSYLINLSNFNKEIREINNPFKIVEYGNGSAFMYLLGAIIGLFFALVLLGWFFHTTSNQNGNLWFVLLFIISLILNLIISYLIIKFIYNPVLQSILTVGFFGLGALIVMGSN